MIVQVQKLQKQAFLHYPTVQFFSLDVSKVIVFSVISKTLYIFTKHIIHIFKNKKTVW